MTGGAEEHQITRRERASIHVRGRGKLLGGGPGNADAQLAVDPPDEATAVESPRRMPTVAIRCADVSQRLQDDFLTKRIRRR